MAAPRAPRQKRQRERRQCQGRDGKSGGKTAVAASDRQQCLHLNFVTPRA
jgi:hypothetical protein